MGKLSVPKSPTLKTTEYNNFKGVDFSQDASLVDRKRSPYALNLISDEGGHPIKRLGWRTIHNIGAKVHCFYKGEINGEMLVIAHCGNKIYKITDDEFVELATVGSESGTGFFMRKEEKKQSTIVSGDATVDTAQFYAKVKSAGTHEFTYTSGSWKYAGKTVTLSDYGITTTSTNNFSVVLTITDEMKGYLWFTAGKKYWYFDGTTVGEVKNIAKRPKILISRNPSGGGTSYEEANLLTGKRTVAFLGTESDTKYVLPDNDISSVDEVRVKNSKNMYEVITDYTTNLLTGEVTFTTAHKYIVEGEDNIEIDYTVKNNDEKLAKIEKCTISSIYGYNASNRIFMSGNSDFKAHHWYSGVFDPTYFGDLSYQIVGSSETAIMGYSKVSEYLAVVKESNQQDTTIFFCYGEMDSEQKTVFRTKQGVAGIGAISSKCFVTLGDESLFLSSRGVYAVTTSLLSYDRVTKNRSYFVNSKLTAEPNLKNAVACEWKGYYLLVVNSNAYVLDSRHTSGNKNNNDYSYECYYLENIPASCLLVNGSQLYFGTDDGRICKFNTDVYGVEKYSDDAEFEVVQGNLRYKSGGVPIVAEWCTPNDADVGVQYFKTLNKKGCLAVLSPYSRSSCKCYFVADGNPRQFVTSGIFDIFDWEDIDFERFTFNTNESPQEIFFNKKKKKYKRLQIVIRNDSINEGFGIHEIVKTYYVGNFSK